MGQVLQVLIGGTIVLPQVHIIRRRRQRSAPQKKLVDGNRYQLVFGKSLDLNWSIVNDIGDLRQ